MVSESIRRAIRQQYEVQEKSLDPAVVIHETNNSSSGNDPSTEPKLSPVEVVSGDNSSTEAENIESPATQPSQISFTQDEDEQIRKLEKSGDLGQVVGSQSLLSQELVDYSQKNEAIFSQQTIDTTTMAKKLGLLDEDDDNVGCVQVESLTVSTLNDMVSALPSQLSALPSQLSQDINDASQISLGLSQSFGTLLSAVQVFHEQEEVAAKQQTSSGEEDLPAYMDEYHDPRLVPQEEFDEPPLPLPPIRRQRKNKPKPKGASASLLKKRALPTAAQARKAQLALAKQEQSSLDSVESTTSSNNERKQSIPSVVSSDTAVPAINASDVAVKQEQTDLDDKDTTITNKKRKLPSTGAATPAASQKPKKPKTISSNQGAGASSSQQQNVAARAKSQWMAKQAAELAEQAITNPDIAKKLLLTMALVRVNPRTAPEKLPGKGHVIPEGFHWAQYTPLEGVLKDQMAKYYDLSTKKCQSAQQQSFNNELVFLVREAAGNQGWGFHESFTDKILRDRVRCYYKTHIQNAKKRLNTMVRNPTKKANARHLVQHLHLIQAVKDVEDDGDNCQDGEAQKYIVDEEITEAQEYIVDEDVVIKGQEDSKSNDVAEVPTAEEDDDGIVAEV